MKYNINYNVKVKLNESGKKILEDEHNRLQELIKPEGRRRFELKLDNEGYYKTQMWDLMQTFGPHVHLSCEPPFETEIILTEITKS